MNKQNVSLYALAAVAGLAAVWYLTRKAGETVAAVGNAVNPINHDNVFSGAVNAVGDVLDDGDDDDSFSLGATVYDFGQFFGSLFGGPPTDNQVITAPVKGKMEQQDYGTKRDAMIYTRDGVEK